jgi:hypothetical protein
VTICVATLFNWNYAPKDAPPQWGRAAITATDRMITSGDVQYEPRQLKMAFMNRQTVILVAGDYSLHSQALRNTSRQIQTIPEAQPENIASIYGKAIQAIKRQEAEDIYLAPIGLNTDMFLAQQRELSDSFVNRITNQLQDYRGEDVDALVVGADENGAAQIYGLDTQGMMHCYNDVGFAAIGIGAWHARSRMMQTGYTSTLTFAHALAITYAAKKSAEIAPGVGATATDIHLIFRDSIELLRPDVADRLKNLYDVYESDWRVLVYSNIDKLQTFMNEVARDKTNGQTAGVTGGDAQVNPSQTATETARKDEDGAERD